MIVMSKNAEMNQEREYHVPVLLHETIDHLVTNPDGIYVDATFGGGGHSAEILKRLSPKGKLFAFDQDDDALANKWNDDRLILVKSNYRFFENYLKFYNALPIDGILADIGVSSHQFDEASRGFSLRFDAPLDMRMDKGMVVSAQDILNEYPEEKVADVLFYYGEIRNARLMAKKIVAARPDGAIVTTNDVKRVLKSVLKPNLEKKILVQLFQAIRIEVNDELGALKALLQSSQNVLKPEGRVAVISYHSLEDRLVKNFIKTGNFEGKVEQDFFGNVLAPFESLFSKPVVPNEEEIERNPRSRSAKLRIGVKK